MKKKLLVLGSFLCSSVLSFAGGYQLNLQGLRQLAMGGSGTAVAWDASTIFYNPAGLSSLEGWSASASAIFVMPNTKFVSSPTGTYSAETKSQTFTPFNIYVGAPTSYKSPVSLGVGIYTPFGTGVSWEDNWQGRYMIQKIALQTVFIQPTISYMISDVISVGGGFIYAVGSVDLERALPTTNVSGNDGKATLSGNAQGFGYNLGVHIYASDAVELGFTYRSQVNMKVKRGYASFDVPQTLQSSFGYTAFSSTLPMPQVFSIGAGYHVNDNLTLQADINYTGWSAYDSLKFDYVSNTPALSDSRSARRYKNTVSFRLGGHYTVSDKVAVMLGAAWDPTPIRDGFVTPELPDANRGVFTGGLTYKPVSKLTIMAAVEYATTVKRDATFDEQGFKGMYQTNVLAPGIGVSYDF